MNSMRRWVGHVAVSAAAALSMAAASPSWASQLPDGRQEHAHDAAAPPGSPGGELMTKHEGSTARQAAMDDRIEALVADMNMFTGELKSVAMAELLTAIVERQSVIRDEMRRMHDRMMRGVTEHPGAVSPADEPGSMCSPLP